MIQDSISSNKGLPFRFGKDIPVDIDFLKKSKKIIRKDTTIHIYSIKSPGAYSINLIFDQLSLDDNATLYIYNKERSFKYGPIKKANVKKNIAFWTDIIPGSQIILELKDWGETGDNKIHVSKVIYGYKNIFAPNSYGDSLNCNIDISCSLGDGWGFDGSSVAMMLLDNGTRWCTSSLLNNTARDFKGYMLTAFHCIDMDNDGILQTSEKSAVNNWLFRFNYESSTCGGINNNDYITFNGANFRAAYEPTDFALLEMYNSPDINDCITYAGWSRSFAIPDSGTGIHHPSGDVKKISFDTDPLAINSSTISWLGGSVSPIGSHFKVYFDQGTTEAGSSGSPLFDENHRIVGQLHGGQSGCAPVRKYYGRFSKSWYGGGTPATRLSDWLDPLNDNNIFTIDSEIPAFIIGPDAFCSTYTYSLSDLPSGINITWSASGNISVPQNAVGNSVTVTATGAGSGILTAVLTTSCGNVTLTKNLKTGSPVITAKNYSYNNSPNYSISPYYSIPNNEVSEVPAYVTANFSFEAATSSNVQVLDQSDYSISWNTAPGSEQLLLNFYFYQPNQWIIFQVSATSPCGTTNYDVAFYSPGSGGGYLLYPNPADTELTVFYTEIRKETEKTIPSSSSKEKPKKFEIVFMDFNGNILISEKSKAGEKQLRLDTQNIPEGIYLLQINDENNSITKKIIIKH